MLSAGLPLDDWLVHLETLSPRTIDLGLERVKSVLSRLGLERPRRVFHVGGTNGKGSSVIMLQALLRSSGERVGSYTSPHILDYNERIAINGEPVSDASIVAAFEAIEAVREDVALTYFEFGTLAALVVFAGADVDAAILEVGMGGRLDAVNAVEPDACLITNVTIDHCDWLGTDIETIAREKAGIMRPGKPAVFGAIPVPQAIVDHAADIGAALTLAGRDFTWSRDHRHWTWVGRGCELPDLKPPALAGEHQLGNAAGVLALVEAAGLDGLLETERVNSAFGALRLDGRMQRVDAGGSWLLDVAHNPAAADVLAETLRAEPHAGRTVAVIGMLDDKDVHGVIAPLVDLVDSWIAVTADTPRAIPAAELARQIANFGDSACLIAATVSDAIDCAREFAAPPDRILVTGSFYVVGPVLRELELYSRRLS